MKKLVCVLILAVALCGVANAEMIRMKSGKEFEGTISERTDQYIKVDIGEGLSVTYFLDEIEDIGGVAVEHKESAKSFIDEIETAEDTAASNAGAVMVIGEITEQRNETDTVVEEKMQIAPMTEGSAEQKGSAPLLSTPAAEQAKGKNTAIGSAVCLLGLLVALAGAIWFYVVAFKTNIWWGIGCLLLSPVSLVFLIMNWKAAWRPWLISVAGAGLVFFGVMLMGYSASEITTKGWLEEENSAHTSQTAGAIPSP